MENEPSLGRKTRGSEQSNRRNGQSSYELNANVVDKFQASLLQSAMIRRD